MRLGQRPRQQDEASVDMTPMLDIVFIMLIFFIVTSSFVQISQLDVQPPAAAHASESDSASLQVLISAGNQVYFQQQIVSLEQLRSHLAEYAATQRLLLINADLKAYNGTVVAVMDAAKAAGIEHIALATEPK